jgi:hypothetical protein
VESNFGRHTSSPQLHLLDGVEVHEGLSSPVDDFYTGGRDSQTAPSSSGPRSPTRRRRPSGRSGGRRAPRSSRPSGTSASRATRRTPAASSICTPGATRPRAASTSRRTRSAPQRRSSSFQSARRSTRTPSGSRSSRCPRTSRATPSACAANCSHASGGGLNVCCYHTTRFARLRSPRRGTRARASSPGPAAVVVAAASRGTCAPGRDSSAR